ncbi:MAG: glycosyltransferase family 39 protein, partial [Chloroflexi bacterium]|nr:glycosyltransferase family 39 protein [Chloroflexota bacterium]
ETRLALTALSAICTALSCGLLFALASTLFSKRVAWYAVGLVLLTPLMWLNANKALSDAPGLLAQTLCMYLTTLAVKRRAPLWLAGLGLGIAAGFRPQGALGLALALLLTALWLRARAQAWAATALTVVLGAAAWLLPLLASFNWSIGALRTYLGGATTFVRTQESLFATTLSSASLAARWRELWFWSSQAVFAPAAGWLHIALFLGTLALIGIAGLQRKSRALGLCLAWCLPQTLLHILFLNPLPYPLPAGFSVSGGHAGGSWPGFYRAQEMGSGNRVGVYGRGRFVGIAPGSWAAHDSCASRTVGGLCRRAVSMVADVDHRPAVVQCLGLPPARLADSLCRLLRRRGTGTGDC